MLAGMVLFLDIPGLYGRTQKKPASFLWKIPSAVHGFHVGFPMNLMGYFHQQFLAQNPSAAKKTPSKSPTEPWFLGGVDFKMAGMALFGPQKSFC